MPEKSYTQLANQLQLEFNQEIEKQCNMIMIQQKVKHGTAEHANLQKGIETSQKFCRELDEVILKFREMAKEEI